VKAIGHYEDIRHKVMEGHDKAHNEIYDIKINYPNTIYFNLIL
jgi:hypothetical protein